MKRILLLLLFCFYFPQIIAQNKEIDTVSISFKAKLFTVSEYGVSSKEQILRDINNQKIQFLNTLYKNFIFMKIEFSQPYRLSNGHIRTLERDCNYYMAFNILDSRFYKLGGFDSLDIDDFFDDLKIKEKTIFKGGINGGEVENIDIHCLYQYYNINKRKKQRKNFKCLSSCSKKTKKNVTNH